VVREGSEWAAHGEPKAAAELELARAVEDEATKLGCERVKLIGLESTSGSRRCSSSTGLGFRGSEGGWRREAVGAAEVR
jgi:hypothetical protein